MKNIGESEDIIKLTWSFDNIFLNFKLYCTLQFRNECFGNSPEFTGDAEKFLEISLYSIRKFAEFAREPNET